MKWFKEWWRDLVDYLRWMVEHDPYIGELEESCDRAEKYKRLEKYFPNILAKLNAAVERKEKAN